MKKKILFSVLILSLLITGCSKSEKEKLEEQISSGYSEVILNSKIVNPQGVINSFNEDIDKALEYFNGEILSIKISPTEITEGSFIFPNEKGESIVIDGLYSRFAEDTKSETKTSLICSIRPDDYNLIQYGLDGTYDENGNLVSAPTVDSFYLVGSIYSAVGSGKYNILMKDCLLVPVKNISMIDVPNMLEESSEIVDFVSGENINVIDRKYYWGTFDLNEDGLTDVLNINTQSLKPVSSFEKITQSNILDNLSLELKSSFQVVSNDKSSGFSLPYPLLFNDLDIKTSSSFDGSNLLIANINILGKSKKEIDYANKKTEIDKVFSDLSMNDFYLENQDYLFSIHKNHIGPFNIKMASGEETTSIGSDKIFIRNYELDPYGNITGKVYAKAIYPFEHYYSTNLKIITPSIINEFPVEDRVFYDIETFKTTGEFGDNKTYLTLKEDLVIGNKTKKIINYTITSRPDSIKQSGTGTAEDGSTVNIIKLKKGDTLIIKKMIKEEDTYWFVIKSEHFEGYIPISFDKDITAKDSKIEILGTNYEFNDVFTK